jgi:hypothetical protein
VQARFDGGALTSERGRGVAPRGRPRDGYEDLNDHEQLRHDPRHKTRAPRRGDEARMAAEGLAATGQIKENAW